MNILSLCDQALVAWIISKGAGTADDTWIAKRSEVKSLPETICYCHTFEACREAPYAGNFEVEAFIEVRTDAVIKEFQLEDDPRREAIDRVKATFDCFLTPIGDFEGVGLGEQITREAGIQNFTIINCRIVGGNQGFNPKTVRDRGNAWLDVIHLELTVCPADVL